MKRVALLAVFAGTLAHAQVVVPSPSSFGLGKNLQLRAGYWFGSRFTSGANKVRLEGPSAGVDMNLGQIPLLGEMTLAGTVVWAGSTKSSGDQATLWRLMSITRGQLNVSGWYPIAGYGYASSKARGTTSFDTKGAWVTQIGIGKRLNKVQGIGSGMSTSFELNYCTGRGPYNGFSAELSLKF